MNTRVDVLDVRYGVESLMLPENCEFAGVCLYETDDGNNSVFPSVGIVIKSGEDDIFNTRGISIKIHSFRTFVMNDNDVYIGSVVFDNVIFHVIGTWATQDTEENGGIQ